MLEHETAVALSDLLDTVREVKAEGYRLITTTCLQTADGLDIIYHFDRNYQMKHLRLSIALDQEVPSISGIYPGAFLTENEMKDFFGLKVSDLPIDYNGRLFLAEDAPVSPMLKIVEKGTEGEGK